MKELFEIFTDNAQVFIFIALLNYLIMYLTLRHRFVAFYDPLNINLILISCYSSTFSLIFFIKSQIFINLFLLYIIYMLVMVFTLSFLKKKINTLESINEINKRKEKITNSNGFKIFCISICVLIWINFYFNILSSSFIIGESSTNDRMLTMQNNRYLVLLLLPFKSFPLFMLYIFKNRWIKYLASITFLQAIIVSILYGSKGAILSILLSVLFYFYYKQNDSLKEHKFLKIRYIVILAILAIIASLTMITFLYKIDLTTAISLFAYRIFAGGFDLIAYSIIGDIPIQDYGLSIIQFWFASILKIVGLYTQDYDYISQFIMQSVFGYTSDMGGMLPNNNLLVEIMYTQNIFVAPILIFLLSSTFYLIYHYVDKYRYNSIYNVIMYIYFITLPFQLLLDAQSFFIALQILHLVYIIQFIILNGFNIIIHLYKKDYRFNIIK